MSVLSRPHPIVISTRTLVTLLLALLLALPLLPAKGVTAQDNAAPLDLPAMTLRPADLAAEGLEGLGVSFSVLSDDADEIADFIAYADIDPGSDDAAAYAAADADRYYILDIDNAVPDGEWMYSTKIVETFVLEYDDEDDASDGLTAMQDTWSASDKLDEADLIGDIGDDAFFFEGEGIDNWTMEPTERSLLVFQRENLIGGILIYNSDADGTFDQAMTEALGHAFLDRMDAGLDGDTPGVSSRMVRPEVPADSVWYDQYLVIDGVYLCSNETVARGECDLFQARVDDGNDVIRYYVELRIAGDYEAGAPESFFVTSLWTFEDEESAENRFATIRGSLPESHTLELGDEGIRWSTTSDDHMRETVLVRLGNAIFEMRQSTEYALAADQGWTFEPSADALEELAVIQIACLEGTASCAEPVAIPEGMIPAELAASTDDGTSSSVSGETPGTISPADIINIVLDRD